jgi:transposase
MPGMPVNLTPIVRIAAALLIVVSSAQTPSAEESVYVGILEPQTSDRPIPDHLNSFRVRVTFQFLNGHWRPMPHDASGAESLTSLPKLYPGRLAWTVALDGKKVGAVNSVQPASYKLYAEVGIQELTPDSRPPAVRGGAEAFQTWMGTSHFRPLVAISKPNFADPDHWKPIRPLPPLSKPARTAFRKTIALDLSCDDTPARDYPDEYIQLRKAYRSDRGDALVALRANPAKNPCGMNDGAWDSVWFLIRNGDFHLIGTELALVDAGDYSGGGTSEVIFHLSAYNQDGYVLLDLRDLSRVEFEWHYH